MKTAPDEYGLSMDPHFPSDIILCECIPGQHCCEDSFYEALCVMDEAGREKMADYAYKVN